MDERTNQQQAIERLQDLGLKEYEAKSFVALCRLPSGTAKEISEISDVPRTRVYDAVRVLESKGLVEIQHSSPQRFRAVSVEEAVETLRTEFATRADSLRNALEGIQPAPADDEVEVAHEVWALSGGQAIDTRTAQIVDSAEREIVLVVGKSSLFTEGLADHLRAAREGGVDVIVGAISETVRSEIQEALPAAEVFVSGLEWLHPDADPDDDTEIGRLLMVDRNVILVSTYHGTSEESRAEEQAVFGRGFDNGLVTIVRRLMAVGLVPGERPPGERSPGE